VAASGNAGLLSDEKESTAFVVMAKGGKREGAGRKPGIPNKRTQERQAKIAARPDRDPLEQLLDMQEEAREDYRRAHKLVETLRKKYPHPLPEHRTEIEKAETARRNARSDLADLASRAAPYVHARLASTEAKVDVTNHEAALDSLDD
jgi:hypothetical protein